MQILLYCALGALICVGWFFLQMRLFDWHQDKSTLLSWVVSKASLLMLSTTITLVGFTAIAEVFVLFLNAALGN